MPATKKILFRGMSWRLAIGLGLLGGLPSGCKDESSSQGDLADGGISYPALTIKSVNTRARVAEQMRAAIEMQISGEPLAETAGRDIASYVRYAKVPDQLWVTTSSSVTIETDPVGYSMAVETYEYSKMAMNHLSFESGAGLSLMYGPRLNPGNLGGVDALGLLRLRVQALALQSRAGSTGPMSPWVVVPAPSDNPLNRLGFPGLWPQFAEFRSYDPAIAPSRNVQTRCTPTGANGGIFSHANNYSASGPSATSDYECSNNTLHLIDRESQVEKVLAMDALGLTAWKQALWVINYFQFLHDVTGTQLTIVDEVDITSVGQPGNAVQGDTGDPLAPSLPGTYIGSSDLEGFQGLLMAEEIDNKAELLLKQLLTSDGATLGGFASIKAALGYDYAAPLRFFPHAVAVTELPGTDGAEPQPTGFTVADGVSRLPDLTALLGAYSEFFALTDRNNSQIGGSMTTRPVFDGDPFAADNGLADGEQTAHDRALALVKLALVNLDRLHFDPATGALCDSAEVKGGSVVRSTHVTTVETTYALAALRVAYRALTAQLTLYSNTTPIRVATSGALDGTSMAGSPGAATVTARLQQLMQAQAAQLANKLVDKDGVAINGYDRVSGAADPAPTTVDSQAAAVRGLLEAYLSTSDTSYRVRAQQAYAVLEQRYYHPMLRVYRPIPAEEKEFVFTPPRLGVLHGALREMYLLVATRPGNEPLQMELEARIGRLNKLVINGWDDRNGNGTVDYPAECMRSIDGIPRSGLQMGERAITGEVGFSRPELVYEYDHDCVPNISYVNLPATLASELTLVPEVTP